MYLLKQPELGKISGIILSYPLTDCLKFRACLDGRCLFSQNIKTNIQISPPRVRNYNANILRRSVVINSLNRKCKYTSRSDGCVLFLFTPKLYCKYTLGIHTYSSIYISGNFLREFQEHEAIPFIDYLNIYLSLFLVLSFVHIIFFSNRNN